MALKTFWSARAGIETTPGTPLAAMTHFVYFKDGTHDYQIPTIVPEEERASYFGTFRVYPGIERNVLNFTVPGVGFDDLSRWAAVAVKGVTSGTGASADKTWAFAPSATTDDLKRLTVQIGFADAIASAPGKQIAGCVADELSLTWAKNAGLSLGAKLMTNKSATDITAWTGTPADRTNVTPLGTATRVYIDSTTIGTTADDNVFDATWTLTNGFAPRDTMDNTALASALERPAVRGWKLDLTRFYANANERGAYATKTPRKIRIKTTGPVLGGSFYSVQLDLYGYIDSVSRSDVNGFGAEKLSILPVYDTTAATDFSLTVVNSLASIT